MQANEWLKPQNTSKIYEAFSAIVDKRFVLVGENTAKSTSTSRGKFYDVEIDIDSHSIMSNDNFAYYVGEVSYPMIAMFIVKKLVEIDESVMIHFKDIKWKDLNQANKNDFVKVANQVLDNLKNDGVDIVKINTEVDKVYEYLLKTTWYQLGSKKLPPKAY